MSSSVTKSPVASPSNKTTYILSATSNEGCVAKDTVVVAINEKPVIKLTKDTIICIKSPVALEATGGLTYQWFPTQGLSSTTISNPIANPSISTKYFVMVVDNNTCTNIDSVYITVKSKAVFEKPEDKTICRGDTVQLESNTEYKHLWLPASYLNNTAIANPSASPPATITYTVTVTDPVCKSDSTFAVEVRVNPLPIINVTKSNNIDCSLSSAQLNASGAINYQWSPAIRLNDPLTAHPITTALATTTYKVTGRNVFGCYNTDSITVEVKNIGELAIYMPTAFTPNNDGKNDCFGIKKWQIEGEVSLTIYNRWGEVIFATNDPNQCWNGIYKGKLQPAGVFVYILKANTKCGAIQKQGLFTLIR